MPTIKQFDLSLLPEKAQEELYDFYLFLKQRYQSDISKPLKENRVEKLKALKVEHFTPLRRDDIYVR